MVADPVADKMQAFSEFDLGREKSLSFFRHLGLMLDHIIPRDFSRLQAFRYWRAIITYFTAF